MPSSVFKTPQCFLFKLYAISIKMNYWKKKQFL